MRALDFVTTAAAVGIFGYFVYKVILPKLGDLKLPSFQPIQPPAPLPPPQQPAAATPDDDDLPTTQPQTRNTSRQQQPPPVVPEKEGLPTTGNALPPTSTLTKGGGNVNGITWLLAKGPVMVIPQHRNEPTDKRWSKTVSGYSVGFEATVYATITGVQSGNHIGLKHWGPNHKQPCSGTLEKCLKYQDKGGMCCCCWYDSGIKGGKAYLEIERPHNLNINKPCPTCFSLNTGDGMHGVKWAVYPEPNGGTHIKMWVDTTGKVSNQWRPVYDIVDKGQIMAGGPYKVPNPQEIEMRISDTPSVTCFGGGLLVRRMG